MDLHRPNKKYKKRQLNKRHFNGQLKMKCITLNHHQFSTLPSSIHPLRMNVWRVRPYFLTNCTRLLKKSNLRRKASDLANKRFAIPRLVMNHLNPALPWDHKSDQYNQRSFRAKVRIRRSQLINNPSMSRLLEILGSWQRPMNKVLLKVWASLLTSLLTINP